MQTAWFIAAAPEQSLPEKRAATSKRSYTGEKFAMKVLSLLVACTVACPAVAEHKLPPFTEAVLPIGNDIYAVSIGPGGPDEEFGSDATNGGLYKVASDGASEEIKLSDGQGLRNPTGMVRSGNQIVIVDGNEVISTASDGTVNWRQALDEDGVFLYDIEVLDENTILVSDFGRGRFLSVATQTGQIQPYLGDLRISGLARFAVAETGIYAVSWGSDDAWDSALYWVPHSDDGHTAATLSDGFGNLESVELINDIVVVGGYRGHKEHPIAKLMRVETNGTILPLDAGSHSRGISDILFDGSSIWLTYFYDASYAELPSQAAQNLD
ncbi:hypothetical protein M3P21_22150 [Ruegeria sp. 2012CJ41-6]|uniref:Uncharacterized protein n=1 Tax=Ruegeria spongiae TaxID=2942209 RepID=A0ABT0QAK5_9RHOB|nr:hypothetical protein [Ruegeria spongiae]MCL6286198.1 hypothetical protein [Ruegeria spongiae]